MSWEQRTNSFSVYWFLAVDVFTVCSLSNRMWHTSILYIAGPFNSPHVGFFHITHSSQSNRSPVNRESLCCLDPLTLNLPVRWGLFCVNWLSSEEPKELGREPKCGPSSRGLRLGTTSLPGEASVLGVSFLNASSGPALHRGWAWPCFGAAASGVCPRCT